MCVWWWWGVGRGGGLGCETVSSTGVFALCECVGVTAVPLGIIVVENNADLEQVREQINKLHLLVRVCADLFFIT